MRKYETYGTVAADGTVTVHVPAEVKPGDHVNVLVEYLPATELALGLAPVDTGPWPEGFTASREQLYGDEGR